MAGREGAAGGRGGGEAGASPRRDEEDGEELGDGASAEASVESFVDRMRRAVPSSAPASAAMAVDDAANKDELQRPTIFVNKKTIGEVFGIKIRKKRRPDNEEGDPKFGCQHYTDKDVPNLQTTWIQIFSSKSDALCEHCQRGKKKNSDRAKVAKGQGKDQSSTKNSFWKCLDCGKVFCGGRDKVPQGHVRPHSCDSDHFWAASNEDPTLIYCFKCNEEISPSFLDLKLLETISEGHKITRKMKKPLGQMLSSPPCSEGDSHQELGPLDTEQKPTPASVKTSNDTNVGAHRMPGPLEQLKVSSSGVTSKSAPDKEGPVIVKGMRNYGNTCFFNAVLQSLLALSSLRATILRSDVHTGHLALLLKELFLMTQVQSGTADELNIKKLKDAFLSDSSLFAKGKMHCSHECFSSFRLALHKEEIEEWKKVKVGIVDHLTIASFIFNGIQYSALTGKVCKHYSPHESTTFTELLLSVPSKWTGGEHVVDGPVSLHDCLQAHLAPVPISGWECTECNSGRKKKERIVRDAVQKSYIRRVPVVLTIVLGRVSDDGKKLSGHVSFPLVLDTREFIDPSSMATSDTLYNLVAVIEHSGTPDFGHYVSYTKSDNTWFCASDLLVDQVSEKVVLACEAFLLFYERVGDTSPPSALLFEEDQLSQLLSEGDQLSQLLSEEDQWTRVGDKNKKMKKPMTEQLPVPIQQRKSVRQAKIPSKLQKPHKNLQKSVPPLGFSSSRRVVDNTTFLEVSSKSSDENVKNLFVNFLDRKYKCLKGIFNGGCSFPFNVSYRDILKFSRYLALKVSEDYNRLIKNLEEAAIDFMKEPNGSDPKVTLKILQRPKRHETWKGYKMRIHIKECMPVYGHRQSNLVNPRPRSKSSIFKPTREAQLMLKGILCHMVSKHKKGFSWGGNFGAKDVDVYNEKIFIIHKPPNKFTVSTELIEAMEKDFLRYAQLFLSDLIKFLSHGDRDMPYLRNFNHILSNMKRYAQHWLDEEEAERFRVLLVNHPFLKPSIIRSYLLSGIYTACRAHDLDDSQAEFKTMLRNYWSESFQWVARIRDLKNTVCTAVLEFDGSNIYGMEGNDGDKSSGQVAKDDEEAFEVDLESFVKYMRHLFHHGPDHSKEKRPPITDSHGNVHYPENIPRKQFMHSLEESETGASVAVDEVVWVLLLELWVNSNMMSGMVVDVWDAYKNYSNRSDPIGESEADEWLLLDDDDHE